MQHHWTISKTGKTTKYRIPALVALYPLHTYVNKFSPSKKDGENYLLAFACCFYVYFILGFSFSIIIFNIYYRLWFYKSMKSIFWVKRLSRNKKPFHFFPLFISLPFPCRPTFRGSNTLIQTTSLSSSQYGTNRSVDYQVLPALLLNTPKTA